MRACRAGMGMNKSHWRPILSTDPSVAGYCVLLCGGGRWKAGGKVRDAHSGAAFGVHSPCRPM